jgi:CubicO group peptidase (beta-lactamase class C family)
MADRKHRIPNEAQTQYRIGTTTNQFTAMAVLQLQRAGELHVRDHVCLYVPHCPKAWRPITIQQLLTHTSGMDNFPAQFDTSKPTTPARLVAAARATPLIARPGSTWSYSNLGYYVLGFIIEKVSRRSYGSYLQAHIFAPLRMFSSAYFLTARPRRLAVGYADAYSQSENVQMSNAFSSAGVYSTVRELYRWDRALSGSAVAPRDVVSKMFTPYVTICRNNCVAPGDPPELGYKTSVSEDGYGYGWGIARLQPSHHRLLVAAGGFITGPAYNGMYPDDKVDIIVLTNQDDVDIARTVALLQRAVLGKH